MAGGIFAGIIMNRCMRYNGNAALFQAAAMGYIGGILPDIDAPYSKISNKMEIAGWICRKAGHRCFFHSPLCYLALYILLLGHVPATMLNPLIAGVTSHLFLDMLNSAGIPILYPMRRRTHLLSIKSGGIAEKAITACLIMASIMLAVSMLTFPTIR